VIAVTVNIAASFLAGMLAEILRRRWARKARRSNHTRPEHS